MTLIDLGQMRRGSKGPRLADAAQPRLRYEKVIELLEQTITERQLVPGDLLPTQAELCELAGVSRITVTRALTELERQGRIRRHQGVGTFLARPRITAEPARSGGLLGTVSSGAAAIRVGTRVLSLVAGLPSHDLREALKLRNGARIWWIHRQRLLDGRPMVVETAAIPVELAPDLDCYGAEVTDSLYGLLERRYLLEDASEEQYLEVVSPTDEQRRLLNLSAGSSVVRIRGLSIDPGGRPFDCFEQVYPASDFAFYLPGGATRELIVNPATKDWTVSQIDEVPSKGGAE
ncbi:MAG: GntR family transcriptional regulator [Acidimicrobiales bacterium]